MDLKQYPINYAIPCGIFATWDGVCTQCEMIEKSKNSIILNHLDAEATFCELLKELA